MKTQLDIYNSAHAAALASLDKSTAYEVECSALATFQAEKQDERDWPLWKSTFDQHRQTMANLRAAKAPSAMAAVALASSN